MQVVWISVLLCFIHVIQYTNNETSHISRHTVRIVFIFNFASLWSNDHSLNNIWILSKKSLEHCNCCHLFYPCSISPTAMNLVSPIRLLLCICPCTFQMPTLHTLILHCLWLVPVGTPALIQFIKSAIICWLIVCLIIYVWESFDNMVQIYFIYNVIAGAKWVHATGA